MPAWASSSTPPSSHSPKTCIIDLLVILISPCKAEKVTCKCTVKKNCFYREVRQEKYITFHFEFLFSFRFSFSSFPVWICSFQFSFYCWKMFCFSSAFISFSVTFGVYFLIGVAFVSLLQCKHFSSCRHCSLNEHEKSKR